MKCESKRELNNELTYRLLEAGEINGKRAFIQARAKRHHRNVGNGRNYHHGGETPEENSHEEVAQSFNLFLHSHFKSLILEAEAVILLQLCCLALSISKGSKGDSKVAGTKLINFNGTIWGHMLLLLCVQKK